MGKQPAASRHKPASGQAAGKTSTPLLEFSAHTDFHFNQHNSSPRAMQWGKGGERYYTSLQQFANQAILSNAEQFRIVKKGAQLRCLPRTQWANRSFKNKRVLFLLPAEALGENVAMLLFLQAFSDQHGPSAVGVFCAASAADIYLTSDLVQVYSLWISRRDLKTWDVLIDLNQLEGRRNIELWPVDMEADLLFAFGLAPSERYPSQARAVTKKEPLNIGILPLASSPLRTLPPATTVALAQSLANRGKVTLCLNRNQHQGRVYRSAINGKLPDSVSVVEVFESIADLLQSVAGVDYVVMADSGPAHMSKLFATPGTAVYSSAPGDVLQGRFTNLARWTIPFEGPHCSAPCGLAKLRQGVDGRIGCMGSLGVTLEQLPEIPRSASPDIVEQLLLREPVPCIASLAANSAPLVDFVLENLEKHFPHNDLG